VSVPVTHLKYTSLRDSKAGWAETPNPVVRKTDQKKYLLAQGEVRPALVLSHDCDLDKPRSNPRVLVAPIGLMSILEPGTQITILEQRHLALLPLPALGTLGDCFADLRLVTVVPRDVVLEANRIASLTDEGRERLQVQISRFLFRREPPAA
jgi:hypothetical protein